MSFLRHFNSRRAHRVEPAACPTRARTGRDTRGGAAGAGIARRVAAWHSPLAVLWVIAWAAVLTIAAATHTAGAQERAPRAKCRECEELEREQREEARERARDRAREREEREGWAAYQRDVDRLRARIAKLQRQRLDAPTKRSLRSADSVLRRLEPEMAGALSELALLNSRLEHDETWQAATNPQLHRLTHDMAELQARLAHEMGREAMRDLMEAARAPQDPEEHMQHMPRPRGWLGVSYSGSIREKLQGGELYLEHDDYPRIESVEPGSPAATAGLARGDTVIAYNGRDVRRGVAMAKLLEPGARVVVRVRRRGAERDVPVRIARSPEAYVRQLPPPPTPQFEIRVYDSEEAAAAPGEAPRRRPRRAAHAPGAEPTQPVPAVPPVPPVRSIPAPPAPAAPPAPLPPATFFFGGASSAVAGAEVVRMNDDLREAFGGTRGVLVINIAAGSPAAQAGLRGGDVIVSADGAAVTTPTALQRVVQRAIQRDADEVRLQVVRKGAKRTVRLQW